MTDLASPASRRRARREPSPPFDVPAPAPATGVRRGRHATPKGQGFGWQVGWTLAAVLIPGAGMIAAGRRRLGLALLGFCVLLPVVGIALLVAGGNPRRTVIDLGTSRQNLVYVALGIVVVGVIWALIVLASNVALAGLTTPRRGQRLANGLLVLALLVGIGVPAYQGANYALIARDAISGIAGAPMKNAPKPLAKADPWKDLPRVNVLMLGGDDGKGREGVRPDTLMVASINTTTGDTVLFSLPRNLNKAPFPNGTPGADAWPDGFTCPTYRDGERVDDCMLNAVWLWGVQNASRFPDDPNPGLTATTQAVEGVLGLDISYYAKVNLAGFQDVVNAIGGITVDVDRDIPIGGGHNQQTGRKNKIYGYIKAGQNQKLDGHEALWFARSREGSTDYDRMRRQRCTIGAISKEVNPMTMLTKFPALAAAAKKNIEISIPPEDLQEWAELAIKVQKSGVRSLPFTNEVIDSADPDFPEIRQLVKKAIQPPAATPAATATTPAATATPSATPTPTPKPSATAADPSEAVRVDQVC